MTGTFKKNLDKLNMIKWNTASVFERCSWNVEQRKNRLSTWKIKRTITLYLIFFDDFFTFIVFQTILRNWLKDYLRKQLGDAVAPNY